MADRMWWIGNECVNLHHCKTLRIEQAGGNGWAVILHINGFEKILYFATEAEAQAAAEQWRLRIEAAK